MAYNIPGHQVGWQLICDIWSTEDLDSVTKAERAVIRAAKASGAQVVQLVSNHFEPHGVTVLAVLEQSHIALHTWPEHNYVAVDLFSCTPEVDFAQAFRICSEEYRAVATTTRVLSSRGRPELPGSRIDFRENDTLTPTLTEYPNSTLVFDSSTEHQAVKIIDTPGVGRALILDDVVQVAEIDAFAYSELLAHPAISAHPSPRRVALVGGGDGFVAAEILKHDDVEELVVFELDAGVVETASAHFQRSSDALSDHRVRFVYGDAFDGLSSSPRGHFDVILCDMTDPVGQAVRFFERGFYELAREHVAHPGIFAAQSESIYFHRPVVRQLYDLGSELFDHCGLLNVPMVTYPGSWWTFVVCGVGIDPRVPAGHSKYLDTKLYREEIHAWYFLPNLLTDSLL